MKPSQQIISILAGIALLASNLIAGSSGKIVGKITDKQTSEPVVGANVVVVGTQRGATTDTDGKYTIIGVPIGENTIRASQVGYTTAEKSGVKIGVDETTQLNFELSSSEVIVGGVTTTADAKLVNNNVTTGTVNVSAKSIESIPNVKSVEDVLKLQAGVVKQGNNLFLRGGRANEVQYLVDGIPTNSIVGNSGELLATNSANNQLQQLYAGVQSGVVGGGASGLAVSANAIASVSVQTSGFDADYGNAQSGIINITTKSGSDKYTGSMQYRTDRVSNSNQNESYGSFSFGGPEPISKYVLPGLGAKIPGSLTFFLSADVDRADGPFNYVHNDFFNPVERKIELNGFLGGIMNGLGFKFRDNQKNAFTFNSKLRYDISGNDQLSYGYRASLSSKHDYFNDWKYRADSSSLGASLSVQNNLSWQHFFSDKAFFRMYVAKLESKDGNDIAGLKPPDYRYADPAKLDINDDGFIDLGASQRWYNSLTKVWSFRIDLNSQVHPLHLLKTGFEFNVEEISSTEILYPTHHRADPADSSLAQGDYPGYGDYRWNMHNFGNRGGLYVQDNIEFSGLNLHIGLRYDYLDVGRQVFDPDWTAQWVTRVYAKDSVGRVIPEWVQNVGFDDGVASDGSPIKVSRGLSDSKRFLYYLLHGNFSPRLSIGYPVTDRIVFYFNYGHFLQYPDRDNYFRESMVSGFANDWIGNPALRPQRTVSYEAGFEDQFADDMAFAVHAFYKDIFDYPTFVKRPDRDLRLYKNLDYASARGFEITFNQALTGSFSTSVSYSYQLAKGRSSNPLLAVVNPLSTDLPRETRLDWDQNHTVNVFATYRVPANQESHPFGLPFSMSNYGVSLTWSLGSGFPYNGFNPDPRQVRYVYLVNNETKPSTSTVNLSIYKGFQIMSGINLLATLDITNLLNRRNVTSVFDYTGRPTQFGDLDATTIRTPSPTAVPWNSAERNLLAPTQFEAPRQILLGVKLNWE